jgi:uncharacterized RDD family membrane protein YckC
MYCRKCGAQNPENSNYCGKCGAPLKASAVDIQPPRRESGEETKSAARQTSSTKAPSPAVPPGHTRLAPPPAVRPYYAGFWKRFAAHIIDKIILSFIGIMMLVVVAGVVGVPMGVSGIDEDIIAPVVMMYLGLISLVINWLYFTVLESSGRQATLGKMAMGIVVTDMEGRRISFGRANGRFWSKILSGMFFLIGYIIAGFTERKQALHDLIAATLVINR